jgi:phage gp46-like protein
MADLLLRINDEYMVDFVYNETSGSLELAQTLADIVVNNIIMSIMVRKNELPGSPGFGSDRYKINRSGDAGARLLEQCDIEATRWIVQRGRAVSIDVAAEPVAGDPGRFRETITATLPGGEIVPFETFYRVG